MKPEPMITVQKMAELTALSERYIRLLIEDGRIPAYRFGPKKGLRIKKNDAVEFIESRRV